MYRMSQCRPNSKLSAFECFPEHSAKALLGLCQCSTRHLACPPLMRGQSKLDRREAPGTPATGKMQNGQPNFKRFIHIHSHLNTTASTVLPDLKQTLDVLHCYTSLHFSLHFSLQSLTVHGRTCSPPPVASPSRHPKVRAAVIFSVQLGGLGWAENEWRMENGCGIAPNIFKYEKKIEEIEKICQDDSK